MILPEVTLEPASLLFSVMAVLLSLLATVLLLTEERVVVDKRGGIGGGGPLSFLDLKTGLSCPLLN